MNFIPLLIIANKHQIFYLNFNEDNIDRLPSGNLSIEIIMLQNYQSHFLSVLPVIIKKLFIQFTQSIRIML